MELKELLGDAFKDGMTMEEVTDALKGIELPKDQSAELAKLKETLSKSNSEAADWKKKFRETQDEATRKAAEDAESVQKMQEELEQLRRDTKVATYKASYISMGYSEENAKAIAEALAEGKTDKVMEIQKKQQDIFAEQIKKDMLKNTHRPGGSDDDDSGDKEDSAVKRAQELAKASSEQAKRTSEALKQYLR